jgi:hypothetical protein
VAHLIAKELKKEEGVVPSTALKNQEVKCLAEEKQPNGQ